MILSAINVATLALHDDMLLSNHTLQAVTGVKPSMQHDMAQHITTKYSRNRMSCRGAGRAVLNEHAMTLADIAQLWQHHSSRSSVEKNASRQHCWLHGHTFAVS